MPGILGLEFQNSNSIRRYPLSDDSSGVDTTGSFQLPNSFLLEFDLAVSAGVSVDPSRFFLQQLGSYAGGFQLTVGYQPASGPAVPVATTGFATVTHVPGNVYLLSGLTGFADISAKVVVGKLDAILLQPAGLFNFTLANARIEPDCVRPIIKGVSSIAVVNGTQTSLPLTGDVEIVADQNIQLTVIQVSGQIPQIRISAIQGEGLSEACVCVGSAAPGPPVRTINGIGPDPTGNFVLQGDTCLQIAGITNGLQLSDSCSQPCCGCNELEVITQQLEAFGTQASTIQGFIANLTAQVQTMSMTVLGSTLGDSGCNVCS